MRQVPSYLVIGSGRVAKHFQCYLNHLQVSCQSWSRKKNTSTELVLFSDLASSVLLLISDSAIPEFIDQHPFLKNKNLIHFSGSLSVAGVHSAHPLMTFASELYDFETYKKIPFIVSAQGPTFSQLLPGLPNRAYPIAEQARPYYHALCVLSGNFTVLLWQKCFTELEARFQIPKEAALPYLKQVLQNLVVNPEQALTGPLARGDQKTVAANLKALENDDFQKVYRAFLEAYQTTHFFPSA